MNRGGSTLNTHVLITTVIQYYSVHMNRGGSTLNTHVLITTVLYNITVYTWIGEEVHLIHMYW